VRRHRAGRGGEGVVLAGYPPRGVMCEAECAGAGQVVSGGTGQVDVRVGGGERRRGPGRGASGAR
jgi:hypothetical protein